MTLSSFNVSTPHAAAVAYGITRMPPKKDNPITELPEGFIYQPEFLSETEESELLSEIATLSFRPFEFRGYVAKRRVVEYGWKYDFGSSEATETEGIPDYLLPLRKRVADFAGIPQEDLIEAVVTEYPAGAPIGWHGDAQQFEIVIGLSLRSACRMRFKPFKAEGKLVSITLEPRSLYVLQGRARWSFLHSIPAVPDQRYSITFRTLRPNQAQRKAPS